MTETTIPNNQHNLADLSAPIKVSWSASTYHDDTRSSLVFRLAAGLAILGWLSVTGWIVTKTQTVGSPDEASNAYFMSVLAKTGQYRVDTGLPAEAVNYVRPRSIAVQGQFLASGSFLGLVQAGALTIRLFGLGAERFLTPLLSLGGLMAVFFIFRRFWGRWWALLGTVLIALHPAFFEFATLPYLHNGAFVACLMIAGWALLRLLERPGIFLAIGFGLAYGAALLFRPVEVLWTAPAVGIILLARKLWRELLIAIVVVIVVQSPWLLTNRDIYGSWLSSGYTPSGVFTDDVGTAAVAEPAKRLFTPAGSAWSWHWLSSAWWYFVLFMPAWSAMALIALIRYFRRKYVTWSKALKLTVLSLIGIFPLVYYGSWNLYPDTAASVNGALASYVRYWVPLYLMMVPGVIITLRFLSRRWMVVAVAVVMVISQAVIVWSHPVAGLAVRFSGDKSHRAIRDFVLRQTEPQAVVIAGQKDKYFQGDRLAGYRLPQDENGWSALNELVKLRPTYLYVALYQYNMDKVIGDSQAHGLRLEVAGNLGRDILYRFTPAT